MSVGGSLRNRSGVLWSTSSNRESSIAFTRNSGENANAYRTFRSTDRVGLKRELAIYDWLRLLDEVKFKVDGTVGQG